MNNQILLTLLTFLALLGYAGTILFDFINKQKLAFLSFATAFIFNASIVILNWSVANAPPFGTIFHVLTTIPLILFALALFLHSQIKLRGLIAIFALAALIPLTGTLFMEAPISWKRQPILDSAWFIPHVASYCMGYAISFCAFIFLVFETGASFFAKSKVEIYNRVAHVLILIAFPLISFGLISGAVWADSAWGHYWSWDPKENWSLITWIFYLIYLHCQKQASLKSYAKIAHLLGFLAILATCFYVAYGIKNSMHSYN